jgi:predicted house-cleaning noncanonical NTP pyrophosphatase (MazG superfamily)
MREHQKLVRDKIIKIIEAKGEKAEYKILGPDAREHALRAKIVEEGYELIEAASPQKVLEELADVYQAFLDCAKANRLPLELIEAVRRDKFDERGGFDEGFFLISTDP